jgi:predicted site-specific integrase-resolvase
MVRVEAEQHNGLAPARFMTSKELAEALRVQVQTVARWRREKRGPLHLMIHGRALYPVAAVQEFLRDRQRAGEQ